MKNWFEESIKDLFEEFIRKNGYEHIVFDSSKFFFDELENWAKNLSEEERKKLYDTAIQARNYAFNKKYGVYNYSNDFRSECKNWNLKLISKIYQYYDSIKDIKVLAVGSNNGSELHQIFGHENNISFDIVEISKDAVDLGRKIFPKFNFYCESMDNFISKENYYDIYINLRAAYCAGNNLDVIVENAYRSLNKNGLVIFSISNGYIDITGGNRKVIKGVYNPITKICSNEETDINLKWMKEAMINNGFNHIEECDIDSEILLISRKTN